MKQVKFKFPVRLLALMCGLFLTVNAFAQQIAVKGLVKDATGEPVIGATVRIADGSGGAVTDFDGNFTVNVKAGTKLQISYIGYDTQEVVAKDGMIVVLKEDAGQSLNEVVVIGYGAVKKSDLTGSVTALKPDAKNKGVVVNAQDMMQGKIAGVNVTSNDGTPGGGAQIRIRGGSSLNADNNPLIVIDGVPMDNDGVKGLSNPLAMINPQDIESFNVLKDASATAIYGSRGSNGVIIITTKKGHKGQRPTVSYSGSMTISKKKKTVDMMDGNQYREFITNLYGIDSDAYRALGTANTDWQDLIYQTAISHDHNVTVSGAVKNLPYRVSVGYTDQEGILKTSDFQRVTAALNLNPSFLNDHLTFNLNAKGMYAKSQYANGDAVGAAVRMDPTQDPYAYTSEYHKNLLGSAMGQTLQNMGGFFEWPLSASSLGDASWPYFWNRQATQNPLAILNEHQEIARSRSFIGSADVDYKVHGFEDLRLHMTLGADISKGVQNRNVSPAAPTSNNWLNQYYGNYGFDEILKRTLSFSAYAQYYKDFNENQHFDIMGGYEYQRFWNSSKQNYVGFNQPTHNTAPNEQSQFYAYNGETEHYLVSFFGRANYTLMNRYMFTATVRDDGSSRFKDHWALFPSFAFAWKMNEENKLRDISWLSDLKLRLGYGQTGQQEGVANYGWIPSYEINTGSDSYYPILGDGTLYRPANYTPDLKWETTTTYNIGLDWGILKQRLSGSVDWYYRKTTDLLNYAPMAAMQGYRNQAWQNIGSLTNTGVEATINWKALQTKDWYWTIDYNFTYNHNKITDLTGVSEDGSPVANTGTGIGSPTTYIQYHQVGFPANSFYVYEQVYDEAGNPIENCVVDRNGDGQITGDDRYFYKKPTPDVTMGLSSRLEYKNWDFGFSLRASLGNYVFDAVNQGMCNLSSGEVWSNSLHYLSNRPIAVLADNWQTYELTSKVSDRWVHNASFLKCDNITLGYSFSNLLKGGNFRGLSGRVYATASNVFTITNYDGIDPEVANGVDNNIYPRPFSIVIGLNVNL